jgi:hypothetical protein
MKVTSSPNSSNHGSRKAHTPIAHYANKTKTHSQQQCPILQNTRTTHTYQAKANCSHKLRTKNSHLSIRDGIGQSPTASQPALDRTTHRVQTTNNDKPSIVRRVSSLLPSIELPIDETSPGPAQQNLAKNESSKTEQKLPKKSCHPQRHSRIIDRLVEHHHFPSTKQKRRNNKQTRHHKQKENSKVYINASTNLPSPHVSHTVSTATVNPTTKRQRQRQRQRHDTIIAQKQVYRQLGISHPAPTPQRHITFLNKNLIRLPGRSEIARTHHAKSKTSSPNSSRIKLPKYCIHKISQPKPKGSKTMKTYCPAPRTTPKKYSTSLKASRRKFYSHQSHTDDVRNSPIYRSNHALLQNAKTHLWNDPENNYQSQPLKPNNCTDPGEIYNYNFRHSIVPEKLSDAST